MSKNKLKVVEGGSEGGNEVIPAARINVTDEAQVAGLRQKLLEWSEKDTAKFSEQTRQFMLACGVPAEKPGTPNSATVTSSINGAPLYAIVNTTHSEFDVIHGKARRSGRLWDAIPISGRQEFFRIMAEEVAPKYKAAIDLAITLEVGKAGSEFAKTTNWDKWAASPSVGRYLSGSFVTDDKGHKYYLSQIDEMPKDTKNIFFYQGPTASGIGICGSTNGFNYPAALAVPDIVSSRIAGNGFLGKVPSKSPSFLYIRKKSESEALDLLSKRFPKYHWAAEARARGVDLTDETILNRLKNGFGIISGRQVIESWAKECSTLRIVGGKQAGQTFFELRKDVDPKMERTILELAGNNPVVIMSSAANLKGGLEGVVGSIASGNKDNSGQRCTSPRRWFVHRDIFKEVKKLAVAAYSESAHNENGAIGNPLDPATKIGAMDKGGFEAAQDYLILARQAGATVIGGNRIFGDRFPGAWYMTPALVLWDGVAESKKSLMHAEEIFAPIANLDIVGSLDEAIDKTNRSKENLSGAFYCDNDHLHELYAFINGTNLGSLIHNGPPKDLSPEGVHAGRDEGGVGITGSLKSLDQYTKHKPGNNIRLLAKLDSLEAARALAKQLLAVQ